MDAAALQFRPLAIGDADAVHALHGDPATNLHNPYGAEPDLEASRVRLTGWIDHRLEHGFGYELVESDGALVGICGVRVDRWQGIDVLNLYWRLMPEFQGRGLAIELGRRALAAASAARSDRPIVARMLVDNAASARVAERLGLVRRRDLDGSLDGSDWVVHTTI